MAELTPKDRLQPSLLDRLTDDEPDRAREGPDKRVLSPQRLRRVVRRDLGFLLNTTHLAAVQDLRDYPEVERSTVNFGIPDLAGSPASTIDRARASFGSFGAPSSISSRGFCGPSVKVHVTVDPDKQHPNAIRFDVEADLWSQPLPLRLHLRTELNLEDGEAHVTEVTVE